MSPGEAAGQPPRKEGIARRSVLRSLGAGALATSAGGVLAACSSGVKTSAAAESTSTITLGYVTLYTGSLAGFASADEFVLRFLSAPGRPVATKL
jgi:branched-chain amino acid transport system substrate-binding protein